MNKKILHFTIFLFTCIQCTFGQETETKMILDSLPKKEIISVGYADLDKNLIGNAISSLSDKNFNKGIILSPEQLFQGRIAGVQTALNDGDKSSAMTTLIRGLSSLYDAAPLYVIDGVPLLNDDKSDDSDTKNPLRFLNPSNIERIDVVKDGAAMIYGVRATAGVVFIQTKKGSGKGKVEYDYTFGTANISKRYDLLSTAEFNKATKNKLDDKGDTDWQKEIFRKATTNNHNLSYGLGDEKNNLRIALNYLNQQGIVKNTGFKRYNAHLNGTTTLLKNRLILSGNVTFSDMKNLNSSANLIGATLSSNPTWKLKDSTGAFNQPDFFAPSPAAISAYSLNQTTSWHGVGSILAKINIIEGLSVNAKYSIDKSRTEHNIAYSRLYKEFDTFKKGRLSNSISDNQYRILESYLEYKEKIKDLDFQVIGGIFSQISNTNFSFIDVANFSTSDLTEMIANPTAATEIAAKGGLTTTQSNIAIFMRSDLNYKRRYTLSVIYRREKFPFSPLSKSTVPQNATHQQLGGSFRWNIHKEAFMPQNIFSELALRTSISHFTQNELLAVYTASYNFLNPFGKSLHKNLGVDLGILKNRIQGSFDIYNKKSSDLTLLVYASQPAPSPLLLTRTSGILQNKGVEANFCVVPLQNKNFTWKIRGNFSTNKSLLDSFPSLISAGYISGQGLAGAYTQRLGDQKLPYNYYLRNFDSFDKDGNTMYKDGDFQAFLDGKSPFATHIGSFINEIQYKNFDFSIIFTRTKGNYIYNNTANGLFTRGRLNNGKNVTKDVLTSGEGSFNSPDASSRFLEDGSFWKLVNISISYTIKPKFARNAAIRLFAAGQNLKTWTKYSGQDPDFIRLRENYGVDNLRYPSEKVFSFGVGLMW